MLRQADQMLATLRTLAILVLLPPAAFLLFIFAPAFRYAEGVALVGWALVLAAGMAAIHASAWRGPIRVAAFGLFALALVLALPFILFVGGCAAGPCQF